MNQHGKCPNCNADWDGGSILDTFLQQKVDGNTYWSSKTGEEIAQDVEKNYSHPRRWSRLIGIEIQGEYDGVSQWMCPDCEARWSRFTGKRILKDEPTNK